MDEPVEDRSQKTGVRSQNKYRRHEDRRLKIKAIKDKKFKSWQIRKHLMSIANIFTRW